MAWNEPGKGRDPWGGNNGQQGPPDLDELVRNLQNRLRGVFGGGGSGGPGSGGRRAGGGGATTLFILAGVAIALFAASAYRVDAAEEGIVLRLGAYNRTSTPGLHFLIPLVETVEKVNTAQIETFNYSNQMLTSDENIVFIEGNLQFRRGQARDYLFSVLNPEQTVEEVLESAIREVVGKNTAEFILIEDRKKVATDARDLVQETLDFYNTGIVVTALNFTQAQPPPQVQEAVDDATKAREDKDRFRLQAEAYSNDVIPKARGAAARQIQQAEAYQARVIADAEGEAARFEALLAEYEKAPVVTRQRLYLEAIEEIFAASNKVIVDTEGNGNLLYLPVDKLMDRPRNVAVGNDVLERGGSSSRTANSESSAQGRNPRAREKR